MAKYLKFALLLMASSYLSANDKVYAVGVVPQFDSRQTNSIWQPIMKALSDITEETFLLKTSASMSDFEKSLKAGEFDFAYMNPYHLIVANESQGYLPVIRDVGRSLYGILVVKKNSTFQKVDELDGKTVAFPAPNSLGAALLHRAEFSEKFQITVKELFVNSHDSVYLNVLVGKADAGGGVLETFERQPDKIKNNLRVLYKTQDVPSHPFTKHPRVSEALANEVVMAFLTLGSTEPGKKLLSLVPINNVGMTSLNDYRLLKSMGLKKYYIAE